MALIVKLRGLGLYAAVMGLEGVEGKGVDETLHAIREASASRCVQAFDADFIAGPEHLICAATNAVRGFKAKPISRALETELLLYASGQRQIDSAIRIVGLKPSSRNLAILAIDEDKGRLLESLGAISRALGGRESDSILSISSQEKLERIVEAFGISREEMGGFIGGAPEAVRKALIERSALLAIRA
jgi:tRNA threonylcarbamoyladenosine modification (KEOPS) complex Cgi121 subunit